MVNTTEETPDPRQAALDRLENAPWGDVEQAREDFVEAMTLALEALMEDIELWDNEGEKLYGEEFAIAPERRRAMSAPMRHAYAAPQVKNAALAAGLPQPGGRPAWPDSPMGLVEGLAEDLG